MKYLKEFWILFSEWDTFRAIILDNIGTIVFNILGMIFIGVLLYSVYMVFLFKKKILKRKPKYYNWIVKLYVPLLFVGSIYIFGQLGIVRGVFKICEKHTSLIVANVYQETLSYYFESESSKIMFILGIKQGIKESKGYIAFVTDGLNIDEPQLTYENETFYSAWVLKISDYIKRTYKSEIYHLAMHTAINKAGEKIGLEEVVTYDDFKKVVHFLDEVKAVDIEILILEKMTLWIQSILSKKYNAFFLFHLILILALFSFPILEFLVYKKWIEPKYIQN